MTKRSSKAGKTSRFTDFTISEVPTVEAKNFTMNWTDIKSLLPIKELTIKRVYWIDNVKGDRISGQHFHKDDESEIFVVLSGTGVAVIDNGSGLKDVPLKKNTIMWVPRLTWHGFKDMSSDFIIIALTTTLYDPERKGYVTDYEDFKQVRNKK